MLAGTSGGLHADLAATEVGQSLEGSLLSHEVGNLLG